MNARFKMRQALSAFFLLALLWFCNLGTSALAQFDSRGERILDFVVELDVLADGTVDVTETITVQANGQQIRRGIFRDFRRFNTSLDGRRQTVGIDVLAVSRDGVPEPSQLNSEPDRFRLYIGESDVFLDPGIYTYQISYQMDRQVRFGSAQDELIWNLTGNYWSFPIERARGSFALPEAGSILSAEVFTGAFGTPGNPLGADISVDPDRGGLEIDLKRTLAPGDGLSMLVRFSKGVVNPPSGLAAFGFRIRDHLMSIISLGGLIVVFMYYLYAWRRVGRDPPKGVIVPRWDVPDLSPALVSYITARGLHGRPFEAVGAALVNLAVKGKIRIYGFKDILNLTLPDGAEPGNDPEINKLPVGERALFKGVQRGAPFALTKTNGPRLKRMLEAFRKGLEREHRNVYFFRNRRYCVPGIALSIATLIGALVAGNALGAVFAQYVFLFCVVSFALVFVTYHAFKTYRRRTGFSRLLGFLMFIPVGVALIGLTPQTGVWDILPEAAAFTPAAALAALLATNLIFWKLLEAPTTLGREALDEIEGLKTYLKLAEQDRMNLAGAPQMSPQHYETLLPYAMALNLEKPWSDTFEDWLTRAGAAAQAAAASSHFGDLNNRGVRRSLSHLSSQFARQANHAMPQPKSSSGSSSSSGGFSGGGGGGMGGGGW